MITLNFEEQHKTIVINYKLLKALSKNISRYSFPELADALFNTGIPSIIKVLINELTMQQADSLWDSGNREFRQALLRSPSFISQLTDKQAQDIIQLNDSIMLENFAGRTSYLYQTEPEEVRRLSASMRITLRDFILNCGNPLVYRALAGYSTAKSFRLPLREYIKNNFFVRNEDIERITDDDLPSLHDANIDTLEAIADYIEGITDTELQKKVTDILLQHEDPKLRIRLAKNLDSPRYAYDILLNDSEPDVVAAARRTLKNLETGDFDDVTEYDEDE